MNLLVKIKRLFTYKGPEPYEQFELLEEMGGAPHEKEEEEEEPKKGLRHKIARWLQGHEKPAEKGEIQQVSQEVSTKLEANLARIKQEFNYPTNDDLGLREFKILQQRAACLVYIEGITDSGITSNYILRQLLGKAGDETIPAADMIDYVTDNLLAVEQISVEVAYDEIIKRILLGKTALFIDGCAKCVVVETVRFEKRAVSTPLTEMVVQGPQEGFIEDVRTNITLIRKILRNKDLITELLFVNEANNTTCALLYIQGIANQEVIAEAKKRISSLNLDFISDGVLSHLIEDHPYALLPQILITERPDRVASLLMEGRIAIVFDGTPTVSVIPATFAHFFHTSEDFNLRWQYGTFLRMIRVVAILASTLLPGLYLALTLFHQEAIPVGLLTTIIRTRGNLPFPAPIELLIMEISWELIREAGVRVPGVVGQTLGIIGGVILGQAAVAAGLVSPILIVIVAIAGLGNFAVPNFPIAFGLRILRFAFTGLGWLAGFYGISIGILVVLGFACSMKSFGVPFFAPAAPKTKGSDFLVRKPVFLQKERPDAINPEQIKKTKDKTIRGWTKK